ncbi:GTPase-associated protein 1-related protein [Streptomyces sp. I05A-00742]|uniref:GTPase-associated protein 1-related protein n=1 Tax=Streptomyces sp. I05A-00742 TaxID=2732853 RepID=UPI001489ABC4|nr:GTPase-associated protein 1-related protein [Streptomyces sp. I05A-00742]
MTLQQLHYSCSSAASGPRFTAASADLPALLLGETEALLAYEPPDAGPGTAPDELTGLPVVFSHNRLSDGTRLLCRTVCTGTYLRGRRHAFHAHAVRLTQDGPLPGGLLPIEAWESPSWADSTPGDGVPDVMTALAPARRIGKAGLLEFVTARAERLEPFLTDVRALFRSPDSPQLLVIERDTTHIAHWIAVASAVLPRELADRLTFTTYTRRPLLARHQIVGAFPGSDFDYAHVAADRRYRVHDCAGGQSSPVRDEPDPWAAVAARILLAGKPALFTEAARLRTAADRDTTHDAGRLAAVALREGILLDSPGRTAAARWARLHASGDRPDSTLLDPVIGALAEGSTPRMSAEWAALAELAEQFTPLTSSAPGERLRRDLRAELDRAAPGEPLEQVLSLLRLAEALRAGHSPVLTARLSAALLGDGAQDRERVWSAVTARPGLTAAVLDTLERTAATGDPASVVRLLTAGFPKGELADRPHLRMAAAVADRPLPPDEDRTELLAALIGRAGRRHGSDPSVLRTAYRLVWGSARPTPAEAAALLSRLPAERHRAAGLDDAFVRSVLESGPDDEHAPAVARTLILRCGHRLDPRRHAALLLLDQAGALEDGEEQPGFAARILALREQAAPLEPAIDERVCGALTRRLLSGEPCHEDLSALVRSGDEELITAYARMARSGLADLVLRRSPEFAGVCFVAWHTEPATSELWDDIRNDLLSSVLRPAVRRMTREELDEVQWFLSEQDGPWAEMFLDWNRRPGVLGRLGSLRRTAGARTRAD